MANERPHVIRLQSQWESLGSSSVGSSEPVHVRAARRFQWVAKLGATERLWIAFPQTRPPRSAMLNDAVLDLRPSTLGWAADVTALVRAGNRVEVAYQSEDGAEFQGALLAVTEHALPMWQPTAERVARASIAGFRRKLAARGETVGADYGSLHRWSVAHAETFWAAVWDFADVIGHRGETPYLVDADRMPGAQWFPEAQLNFAENLLRRCDDELAVISWDETSLTRKRATTFRELRDDVRRLAAGLNDLGVGVGDRVAAYMPNLYENVAAMLAAASLGAVWSSCSPDFGEAGALDRLGQIQPKVLFAADGYSFKGKRIDCRERIARLVERIPSVERAIVVANGSADGDPTCGIPRSIGYAKFLAEAPDEPLVFVRLPFDHPLYILFSSGTTGVPKGIVHGAGGTLLQHLKELILHTDVHPGDRVFYYTTCGWMMWNWLVSALAAKATIVLYEGSPFHPEPDLLWRMADAEEITHFGTSAKYLAAAEKAGVRPLARSTLPALRTILSTGSPLLPTSFDYVYRDVKADVCLSSISGGTDIVSCFALGNPTLPVYRGALQCIGLGMNVEVFDEAGAALESGCGELVCTKPFPSMPVGFWNDPDDAKYRAAYFERFPGVWRHGDFIERTPEGGVVIHGRSDATLNPGGVRIGTAEIYRQVELFPEVLESLAVGEPADGDETIVLFVRLAPGTTLDATLEKRLRDRIRTGATPRHVPAKIVAAPDLPRTLNAKLAELAVRDVLAGRQVRNIGALANPEALAFFERYAESARY